MSNDDRFVRWQSVLRDHISFVNNLFLTISVAIIGFLISMMAENEFHPLSGQKVLFTTGLIITFVSIICGFVATISRLIDFRVTLEKIKGEINGSSKGDLKNQKNSMKLYGAVTWLFLYSQIITLTLGSILLSIAFISIYNEKLF